MDPPRLLLARLAGRLLDEQVVSHREHVQGRLHLLEGVEVVQAVGPRAELAWRLRTAEQEQGHDGALSAVEPQHLVEHLPELGRARRGSGGSRG